MEPNYKLSRQQKVRLITRYLRGCWPYFAVGLACACLSMALNALTPQIIKVTVDSVLGDKPAGLPVFLQNWLGWEALRQQPLRALWLAAASVLAVAVLRGVCSFGQRLNLAKGSESYVKAIRDDLYRHIQHLTFAWHKAHPTGDIIQRCTSDVDVIRSFVCNQMVEVVRTVFLICLYMGIMFSMNLRLSLVALAFIPVVGLSSGVFYAKISSRFKDADEAEGALTTCVQENLTGVRVVRAFGREMYEEEKFGQKNHYFSALWIRLGKLLSVYWASGTLLTALQVMVIMLCGIVETVNGRMTLGAFIAFISYNESLSWPVRSLGRVLSEMSKAGVSMDRVGYILNSEEETDAPGAVEPVSGDIVFDHVTFGYEGQDVLRDVSFTIHEGETFAILGGTGSGKSTLVHLLDRLYDLKDGQGFITIGGVDIRSMKREALRKNIGLVLQEPFLFSQTIGENICATRPKADPEEMRRAASIACVDDAITAFPDGYETVVGERGVTLSGGQKQRVAIARMLMQQAPVMIFDDSLSAVDAETDTKIRAALRDSLASATVILVSHRITTLMQADRILVLDGGRVADLGTHQELISRPGIYKDIYDIQMRADDRALILEGGEQ
ncbi:MAG: ABC transporter ATP-binding protein [Clostridiaceae bacterium]|nr:ABC transporter ATP-binding protein [Clostridia bacterium]MDY3871517.1 ABC transporter ATP-binding protein [Clostridiaceae bacterium]